MEELRCCELPQSVQTHSILVSQVDKGQANLTPPVTEKHIVVTIIKHIYQSYPCKIIQYTYDETLGGLICCEIHESIQTHSILVWNLGYLSQNISHHPQLKKATVWHWLWMMNSNLNLAKPFIILMVREWKGCDAVNWPNQSKVTQSWCEKWGFGAEIIPHPSLKNQPAVTVLVNELQSQPCLAIHHTHDETLEGLRCCEILK